ncbi:MAG: Uncharacterised protein [Cellvibrionales bacterium UBA7375]|nr:MAG: Uncharacterised protein [Cellvibrionales bacterium UBA7375]
MSFYFLNLNLEPLASIKNLASSHDADQLQLELP